MKDKEYKFVVTGGFDVDANLTPVLDAFGNVTGFLNAKGEIIQLVVALEVVSKDESKFKYVTNTATMTKLGLGNLDYDRLEFQEA